jgi:hypothetical protein
MISDKAKAAILDKCCQKVDCLARGEVIDAEGVPDLHQSASPETESETKERLRLANYIETAWPQFINSDEKSLIVSALRDHAQRPPLPQIVQRALDVWSSDQYRSVMLPGLGARTCGKIAEALAAVLSDTSTDREVEWCQPRDCGKPTPRKFMIYFDDPDHGIMVFDNEAEARAAFEKKNTAWSCYLFGTLPVSSPDRRGEP